MSKKRGDKKKTELLKELFKIDVSEKPAENLSMKRKNEHDIEEHEKDMKKFKKTNQN